MPNCTCGSNTSQSKSFLGFLWIALPSSQVKFTRRDMTCFFHECLLGGRYDCEMPRHWWHWQLRGYKVSDEFVGNSKTRRYLGFGWTCSPPPFSVRDLLLKTFATSKAIKLAQPAKFPAACSFYVAVSQRFNSVTHHHGTKSPCGCCCCNICLTSARVNHRASSISLGFTFPLRCI